ncbi:MAG: DnaJ domain-containing protein [Gammaproteobacteria bacterium]|nr:DnaJ domain-containing protein [Gammaproteobacteria bacterium]
MSEIELDDEQADYYRLLQVQPDASAEVIRASHRALMQRLRLHPDLGGDWRRAARLNAAREVLLDPVQRARYDAGLQHRRCSPPRSVASIGATPRIPPRAIAGGAAAFLHLAIGDAGCGRTSSRPTTSQRTPSGQAGLADRHQRAPHAGPGHAARSASARPAADLDCAFCGLAQAQRGHAMDPDDPRCQRCGAVLLLPPLGTSAARSSAGSHDGAGDSEPHSRRFDIRYARRTELSYLTEWPAITTHVGHLLDLSRIGLRFVCVKSLHPGSVICLRSELLDSVASVVHRSRASGDVGYVLGVEFLTLRFRRRARALLDVTA